MRIAIIMALASLTCSHRMEAPPDVSSNESELAALGSAELAEPAGAPAAPERSRASRGSGSDPAKPEPIATEEVSEVNEERLVYYEGYAKLRVASSSETLSAAVEMVEEADGYVENYSESRVVLRIPVELFRSTFDAILKLGDVVARSASAQDITDAFTSVTLRLETLRASRERLIALLAQTTDEKEKLELLREIKRLTEEVDQLAMQQQTLATLAKFSRITLETEAKQRRVNMASEEPIGAFRWLTKLSPFDKNVAFSAERCEFDSPEGMVSLDDPSHWMAESPDGAQVWAHERSNEPRGDTSFWLEAMALRLEPLYAEAERFSAGEFEVLRLVDSGPENYRYMIALRADGDNLQVVEAYFPSSTHEDRYRVAVQTSIAGGPQ